MPFHVSQALRSRLVLRKQIGKGAFAAVFLGTYDGQECAIKVLHPQYANDPNHPQTKMLLREGQLQVKAIDG